MIVISFSGLDGCGKSTHVDLTARYLADYGLRVRTIVTFRASAGYLATRIREALQRRKIVAEPPAERSHTGHRVRPIPRQRTFAQDRLTPSNRLRRWLVYPIDQFVLRLWLLGLWARGFDAVVCDRYTFDKLVNLSQPNGWLGRVVRVIAPTPDAAFFLDADWATIRTRRVEHPEEYYRTKYAAYRRLVDAGTGLVAIQSDTITSAQARIEARLAPVVDRLVSRLIPRRSRASMSVGREVEPRCR